MLRKSLLPLILILVVFTETQYSCKKKSTSNPGGYNVKKDLSFKTGTYWVLRDTVSGRVDSFYVRGLNDGNTTDYNTGVSYEDIRVDIKEVNTAPASTDTANWVLNLVQNGVQIIINDGTVAVSYDAIPYPFNNASYAGLHNEDVHNVGNLLENGITYSGVAQIAVSGGVYDTLYMNKDGFVQLHINHGASYQKNWQLLRHKIVR